MMLPLQLEYPDGYSLACKYRDVFAAFFLWQGHKFQFSFLI